jgi:hypothetical protein
MDVPTHPSDPGMTAWFTMATGDTLERAAHRSLTESCEHHLLDLASTPIAMFPV